MFHLRFFGGAIIEGDAGPLTGPVSQRRRLALLALLASTPSGGISREKLAAYLFPEADTARAHRALPDALHAIRRTLGRDSITAIGDQLRLNPQIVTSDVGQFEAAIAGGTRRASAPGIAPRPPAAQRITRDCVSARGYWWGREARIMSPTRIAAG